MNIHINPETGEPGECKARKNCPFGDMINDHFESKEEARDFYEKQQEFLEEIKETEHKPHVITEHALNSKLEYNGPLPEWFGIGEDEDKRKKIFNSSSEFLDTFEFNNKRIAVIFEPWSVRPQDLKSQTERGFQVSRLIYKDFETGEELGYLNTTNINDESLELAYGNDGWQAMRRAFELESFNCMDKDYNSKNEFQYKKKRAELPFSLEDSSEKTRKFKFKFIKEYDKHSLYNDGEYFVRKVKPIKNSDLSHEEINKELEKRRRYSLEYMNRKINYYKDSPFVDYSKLSESLKGKGLGSSLYIYTAKRLAEDGLTLRGSGIQSEEAGALWRRLGSNPKLNVGLESRAYYSNSSSKNMTFAPVLSIL